MIRGRAATEWLLRRGPWVFACGAAAFASTSGAQGAPGRDLGGLTQALAKATDGEVASGDLRWEPSRGWVADFAFGRRVLFLARRAGDETRDVWRARVRTSPEGAALEVRDAVNLTRTPLGDDHELVVFGDHAAYATRAYGQEQSVVALDLLGEGARNRAATTGDRVMAAVTNLQQTGSIDGVGRIEVTLEAPAAALALRIGPSMLDVTLFDDARHMVPSRPFAVDLAHGSLSQTPPGVRAEASMHLPKRWSHWAVDTLRAVPWIGPAPVAWMEDEALAARDLYRRVTFHGTGDATDVVAVADPPPPPLDTSEASVEEAHWPPPKIPTIWKEPERGEGEWTVPDVAWLRKVVGASPDAPSAFYRTFVRPDQERPYSKVILVAMDSRQLDLDMEAGVEDPEPLTGPHGSGRIPRDPNVYRRVAAAFNGAFKTEHGHYGMMVHKRVLLPPVPAAATVVVLDDARVGFGTWGADRRVGGLVGIDDDAVVSFRQNLEALIDRGQINPTGRNLWGFTLPGKGAQTERSGLCVTTSGHLLYAWGDDVSGTTLAKAMKMGGCDYAIHLDMNPYHTGFLFAAIDDLAGRKYKSALLTPSMSIPVDRYIQYAPKDFFYVTVRDVVPPKVDGASDWEPDGGSQPPPHWLPGLWRTHVSHRQDTIELFDVEPQRATWVVRAGAAESPAAAPLRELAGDESKRVLMALGAGIAPDKRSAGIATAGRVAVPFRGGSGSGGLLVGGHGELTIFSSDQVPAIDAQRGEMLELPLLLWDGKSLPAQAAGAVKLRSAVGVTPSGRVVIARGTVDGTAPLAEVLARAGCVRALALDRGSQASAFIDRAGTPGAPKGRYDETVLYAVATPLPPRAFRFESVNLVAQGSKP